MFVSLRNAIQAFVVSLNGTRAAALLAVWYRQGVQSILRACAQSEIFECVYGVGSFFHGTPLYGHSDIDLILVVKRDVSAYDESFAAFRKKYQRLRWIFPFLGGWEEQGQNVVFLDEAERKGVLPSSLRFRLAHGSVSLLQGTDREVEALHGKAPLTILAALDELAVLLQYPLVRHQRSITRSLFWSRLNQRLDGIAKVILGESQWEQTPAEDGRVLYVRLVNPHTAWADFLKRVELILESLPAEVDSGRVVSRIFSSQQTSPGVYTSAFPPLVTDAAELLMFSQGAPLDLYVQSHQGIIDLRRELERFSRTCSTGELYWARCKHFLVLVQKESLGISVHVLLDRRYPLLAAALTDGRVRVATEIWREIEEYRELSWNEASERYRRAAHQVETYPFPCIYVEDEQRTIRDMLSIWRSYYWVQWGVDLHDPKELLEALEKKHPEGSEVFQALRSDSNGYCPNTNHVQSITTLYRALHVVTANLLGRAEGEALPALQQRLRCSVAIITRNRSSLLRKALRSLGEQARAADEVIVVDNGSTDDTAAVLKEFESHLPLRVYHLSQPSIPAARNYAAQVASGDILCFVDDDCIMEQYWLAEIERAFLRAENIGIVGGAVAHVPLDADSALDRYYQIFHHSHLLSPDQLRRVSGLL